VTGSFLERPILNSPYAFSVRHWELDADGQLTDQIVETRRSELITPVLKLDQLAMPGEVERERKR